MQTQNIPSSDSPTNGQSGPTRGSTDAFVDSALEAFESLGGDVTPGRKPVKEPPAEPTGPGTEEGDEDEEQPLPGEPDEDEGEQAAQDDDEEGEAHDLRGSKEEPFSVKDLPKDKFIELKVDGEKQVVSLADLAAGYIGQATISQRLNKTKMLADEAQALSQRAKEERESVRTALNDFLSDPEQLFAYYNKSKEREEVMTELALKLAAQVRKFKASPEERLRFERARDEAMLREKQERWEAEKQAEMQARREAEMSQRAMNIFKPGWHEGLKKAGFPQGTQTEMQRLYEEVVVRCNQRAASGAEVTTDDVADFTYRACKLLELRPRGAQKPRPAPAPAPKEREPRRGGKDPWKDKPARERVKDTDYFLKNLRSKDFRL